MTSCCSGQMALPYLNHVALVVFMGRANVCLNLGNLCILILLAIFDLNRFYTTMPRCLMVIRQKPDRDSIYIVYILVELIK